MKTLRRLVFTSVLTALISGSNSQGITIISDNYNTTGSGTGFNLGSGINSGINPPTTRLTGSSASGLRYLATDTSKTNTAYSIASNRASISSQANPGRYVLSSNGSSPFDFGPYLGVSAASSTNPAVYDVAITIKNNSSGTQRCSFALGTVEGINTVWDFGFQFHRGTAGDNFYTVSDRVDTASIGVPDFTGTILTMGANTFNTEVAVLMRVTDAGAETNAFNSRVQLSTNAGTSFFYDTASDTNLPNGWRLDGPARIVMWDIAPNAGTVTYDNFSINTVTIPNWVWTGAGANENWSSVTNWNGNASPITGAPLLFSGTTRQANTNDMSGLSISALTFANGGFSLYGNVITNTGSITNLSGNNSVSGNLAWSGNAAKNWTLASGTELTLNNTNTIEVNGDHSLIGGGTLRLRQAMNIGQASSANAVFNVKEGAYIIDGGTMKARNDVRIGSQATGNGAQMQLISGGTLNLTLSSANIRVGDSTNPVTSQLLLDNSTVTLAGGNLAIPYVANASGLVSQTGGSVSNVVVNFNQTGAGTGTYAVTNGTLAALQIKKTTAGGQSQIYFDNAVLRTATGASNTFFSGLNLAEIESGGLSLDATVDVAIDQTLSGPGALAKNNSATVSLNSANTFAGGTVVNAGTLSFGDDNALSSGGLTINGGGIAANNGARAIANAITVAGDFSVSGSTALTLSGALDLGNSTHTITVNNTADTTLSGSLSGTSGFAKSGSGTLVIPTDNSSSLSGAVTLNGGTLKVSNTSGLATGSGNITANAGSTLAGTGIVGTVTLGGTIAAGSSVGTLTTGSQIWNGGASDSVEIINVATTPGSGWDFVDMGAGTLTINATEASPITIDVRSLTSGNVPGALDVFDNTATYSWVIARANGGIVGFSQDKFQVLTGNFANSLGAGSFGVTTNGNTDLVLNFSMAPSISSHPTNVTTTVGGTASFAVTASGSNPVSYQWRKNGSNISGATDTSYGFNPVAATDAGTYSVRVYTPSGFVTSSNAVLSIPPTISLQPVSSTNQIGTSASFTVTADGQAPLVYQWRKDSVNIPGATTNTLAINPVHGTNAGSYSVIITNGAGTIVSDTAVLSTPPEIVTDPTNVTTSADNASLTVKATGSPALEYHWRRLTIASTNEIVIDDAKYFAVTNDAEVSLIITNLTVSDTGNYDVVVNNPFGSKTSAVAVVTYQSLPVVNTQPDSLTRNAGQTAVFTVVAGGAEPLSYLWNKVSVGALSDGGNISGATSASLTITNVAQADAGSYFVTVSNGNGSTNSVTVTLTVIDPPVIMLGLSPIHIGTGSNAVFNVNYSGSASTIIWKKGAGTLSESARLIGTTTTNFTISSVTQSDADVYTVLISNAAGVASNSASLLVYDPPIVTADPTSATRATGSNVTFSVSASGTSLAYQWKKISGGATNDVIDDSHITGATGAILSINNLTSADNGNYYVSITNVAGSTSSGPAALTVFDALTITDQPDNLSVTNGNAATFSVSVSGSGTIGYQWKRAGTNLLNSGQFSGVNTAFLTVSNVFAADATNYYVVVTNEVSTVTSAEAILSVIDPYILTSPSNVIVGAGSNAVFSVAASGTAPLTYQWKKGATPLTDSPGHIVGSGTATLTVVKASTADNDNYSADVSNGLATTASSGSASLTVIDPPVLVDGLANTNVIAGASVIFAVNVSGSAPLHYSWKKGTTPLSDGGNIDGATTAFLTISGISSSDAGSYTVTITNVAGSTSSSATLSVAEIATITAQPVSLTNNAGTTATFSVEIDGTASFQWKKGSTPLVDGGNILGATTASLTITNVLHASEGSYSVTVSNVAGSVTSAAATLTVIDPFISSSPQNTSVALGANTSLSVGASGTAPLKYQWYLKGAPVKSATNSSLSITAATLAMGGNYYAVATNIYGKATSAIATVIVVTPPSFATPAFPMVIKPKSTVPTGTRVVMTTLVKGTSPAYQWRFNNVDIPGATTATNIINAASLAHTGAYSVVVSNLAGNVTSSSTNLTVLLDTMAPLAAIKTPIDKGITLSSTNPAGSILATGTAADTAQLTNVYYRLNGGGWTPVQSLAFKDANALMGNWTNTLSAQVGTNILEVYSVDWTGLTSKVAKATFFFHVGSVLNVSIDEHDTRDGEGSDSAWPPDYKGMKAAVGMVQAPLIAPTNGATLYVNRGPYTLTAYAGHNQIFTNWATWITGSGITNYVDTAQLNFVMKTNLNLQANFIHNPWMEAQGSYYGLMSNGAVDIEISGAINFKVLTNLMFSGKMLVDGDAVPFSGKFKTDGTQSVTLSRAKLGKPPLTLSITNLFGEAGSSHTNQIVGTLTDGTRTASVLADQWIYNGATDNPAKGPYTMVLPRSGSTSAPDGYGYATLTVDAMAKVMGIGALADNTALVPQLGYVSKDGRWPLFNQIYLSKLRVLNYTNNAQFHTNSAFMGMFLGWINVTNPNPQTIRWTKTAPSSWTNFLIKPPGTYSTHYTNGFSLDMPVSVKSYTNNGLLARVINVTNAFITFTGGNLPGIEQTHQLRYGNDAKIVLLSGTNVVKTSTNAALGKLAVALDPKTGKLSGSFTNPITLLPIPFAGAVMQPNNTAYGYFVGTNKVGSVTFTADPSNP